MWLIEFWALKFGAISMLLWKICSLSSYVSLNISSLEITFFCNYTTNNYTTQRKEKSHMAFCGFKVSLS